MMASRRPRALLTVAHPDDESFGCGSLLAWLRAHEVETIVWCATRGEAGQVDRPLTAEEIGRLREGELRAAADLLGVSRVLVGDWHDSGMSGEPAAGTLAAASADTVEAVITGLLSEFDPRLVFTLDASDGHRDHAIIRAATVAAAARRRRTAVYLSCLPRTLMRRWVEVLREQLPESEHLGLAAVAELGTPESEISCQLDTTDQLDLRWQVIRAHGSQHSPYEPMPAELQTAFLSTERLRRVLPPWLPGERDDGPLSYLDPAPSFT